MATPRKRAPEWQTVTNERRIRKLYNISLADEEIAEIDRRVQEIADAGGNREVANRGRVIAAAIEATTPKKNKPKA